MIIFDRSFLEYSLLRMSEDIFETFNINIFAVGNLFNIRPYNLHSTLTSLCTRRQSAFIFRKTWLKVVWRTLWSSRFWWLTFIFIQVRCFYSCIFSRKTVQIGKIDILYYVSIKSCWWCRFIRKRYRDLEYKSIIFIVYSQRLIPPIIKWSQKNQIYQW